MTPQAYDYNLYQQNDRDWNNAAAAAHMVASFSVGSAFSSEQNAYMKPSPSPLPDQQSAGSITPPNNDYSYHYNVQTNNEHSECIVYFFHVLPPPPFPPLRRGFK